MNAAKHFGFKHEPSKTFLKNFFMDIGFGRPDKPGGYRKLTLLDVVRNFRIMRLVNLRL